MRASGIYAIVNKYNNKLYIGSATSIKDRFKWHKRALEKGSHHSILLQRSWNKYGADNFEFKTLELVEDKTKLIEREQHWLDIRWSYLSKIGYNIYRKAGSPKGYKHSEEAKAKISQWGKNKKHSEETKLKMAKYQLNRSEEHKANMSKALKVRIFSEEHRRKLTLANLRRKPVSEETRKRMRDAAKRRKDRKSVNQLDMVPIGA